MKVLFVATVVKKHIMEFHIPYLRMFKEMGWETTVAARNDYENPEDCNIPFCDAYIKSKERKYRMPIKTFRFRLKPDQSDWIKGGGTRMRVDFANGTSKIQNKDTDTFFVGFNNYLFLRRSCYQCRYAGDERIADFTLADFWGVPLDKIPDLQRKFGVSLLLTNSRKAEEILPELSKEFYYKEIDPQSAIPFNQALVKPSTINPNREEFFSLLGKKGFDSLVYRYNRKFYAKKRIRHLMNTVLGEKHAAGLIKTIKKIKG